MPWTGREGRARFPGWLRTSLAALAFAAVALGVSHSTWEHISTSRQDVGFQTDFRDAVYYPVIALVHGVNPYSPEDYYRAYPVGQEFPLYSPVHLVAHLPLAALPLPAARATYYGLNLALILVLAGVSLRLAGYRVRAAGILVLGALLLLSGPGRMDLRNGEPTLLIVLACYLAFAARASQTGRTATGIAVALAKPTFGIPVALVAVCRSRTRAALIGIGAAAAISLVVAVPIASSAGGIGPLLDSLRADLNVTNHSLQSRIGSPLRLDGVNALARATGLRPSDAVTTAVGLLLLAVGAWAVFRLHRGAPGGDRTELAVTLACLLVLVPLFRVGYDLLLLTWPILLLLRRRPEDAIWPAGLRTTLTVLLVFPMLDPFGWSFVGSTLGRDGLAAHLLGPTAAGLCLLAAFAICCFSAARPVRPRTRVAS
jgi:Glycosyltransferase family 87